MLTNVKRFVKKHDVLCVIFIITICISGFCLFVQISTDELWNFQNIYKMYNGYEIYKDANVIITPIFFFIGETVFKILEPNFLSFRIYNICINIALYSITYILFKEVIKSKLKSLIYTLIIMVLCNTTYIAMASYNTLVLVFYLIGILINIKFDKNWWLNGIIIFAIFMTKQNVGIFYILGLIANVIFIKKITKDSVIKFIKEILVFICLFIMYCIYSYFSNNLYYFFSYCFLGIGEFSKNIAIYKDNLVVIIVIVVIIQIMKNICKNKIKKETLDKINIIEYFSIFLVLMGYPIFNYHHVRISIIGLFIELFIMFDIIIFNEIFTKKWLKIILIILLITLTIISIFYINCYIMYIKKEPNKYEAYLGSYIDKETQINIEKVTEYIKTNNKKSIVFGYKAALYNIVLNTSNGAMDLPFIGNFGKDGEDGMLKQIQELRNTNILIEKDENQMIWQESKKIRKWIQDNLNCVGEIENFLIYETE